MTRAVPPTEPATDGARPGDKWKILAAVVFGIFMVILDTTVVNVAFRALQNEFQGDLNDSQWILSVYVLALGITTPLAGFLADRFGIKRIYILGLATFVLGSFLCSEAPNLWFLVAARALQGFGGGLAVPLGIPQIYRVFPVEQQGMALGYFGIALVVGPTLGPILGGWLVDINAWRWIFRINLPIGIVGIVLASRFLVEHRGDRRGRPDVLGLITEIIGFGSVLYAASIAADVGWSDPTVVRWFGLGTVGLLAFAIVELKVASDPLLDLRLYTNGTFLSASAIGYVSVLALFGAEFLMPVYLQVLRGYTALETGVRLLPMAITGGIATPIAGRIYDRIGPRPLIVLGFSVLAINTWNFAQLQADTPIERIVFLLALRGLALGLTVQTTVVTALSVVPLKNLARASSLTTSTRQVAQSLGVAILATVLSSQLSPAVKYFQKSALARKATGPRFALCGELPDSLSFAAKLGIREACTEYVAGFERAYRLTFYLTLVAIGLGLFMPGWPRSWAGRRSGDRSRAGPAES
jgi:EmrB/QacA subfamily drug resistance transporter